MERTQEPARLKLIQMEYFEERVTDREIQEELGISERAFYRRRKELIVLGAERLGWEHNKFSQMEGIAIHTIAFKYTYGVYVEVKSMKLFDTIKSIDDYYQPKIVFF